MKEDTEKKVCVWKMGQIEIYFPSARPVFSPSLLALLFGSFYVYRTFLAQKQYAVKKRLAAAAFLFWAANARINFTPRMPQEH